MSGTPAGAKKAVAKIKAKFGDDFFKKTGSLGGKAGRGYGYTGGFASPTPGPDGKVGRQRAIEAGYKGGKISRRGPSKKADS